MTSLNLYNVIRKSDRKVISKHQQKTRAKIARDELNAENGYAPDKETEQGARQIASGNAMPYIVTYGKDHWAYNG